MTTSEAHREIRHAYVHGGPGAFVSATIWLIAAMVERRSGVATAFATLFFGGFLIFPLGQRYWLFGALLTGVGAIEIVSSGTLPGGPVLSFAVVEFIFAIWLTFGSDKVA